MASNISYTDVLNFLPIKEIKDGYIVYNTNVFAKVMKVGSVNLAYLSYDEQRFKIEQLSMLLRGVTYKCSIVKLERPVDVLFAIEKQERLLKLQDDKFKRNDMTEDGYKQRVQQVKYEKNVLDNYENANPMYHNEFYFIIYGNNKDELDHQYETSFIKFQQLKLDPVRCKDEDIKLFMFNFYNPLKKESVKKFIDNDNYKNDIMPDEIHFSTRKIKTDSMEASIWAAYDYPLDVPGGWLSHIINSRNTTFVINIKHVETSESRKLMDKAITEIRTQMLNRKGATETEAERVQLETFYEIVNDIERGNEILKLVNVLAMTYAPDEKLLRELRRETKSNLKQNNLKIDELPFRQQQAFIAMLPSPKDEIMDIDGRDMPCTTLGAGFPFVFQNLHDRDGFLLGNNNASLIFWDPKVRSMSRTNSNVMVIGKSGSGKSHFTKKMILKMLLEDIKTYIIDPEGEYDVLRRRLGGQKIDVGAGFNSRINPFHIFGQMQESDDTLTEEDKMQDLRSIFSAHIQFLEQFFQSLLPDLTDKETSRLSKLMIETYRRKGIGEFTNFEKMKAEDFPYMDDLFALVNEKVAELSDVIVNEPKRSVDLGDELSDLRNLQVYVERLSSGGSLASLWNGPTTIDTSSSDLIHFDFKRMNSSKNERVMNAQMMLVLRFLENEVSKNRDRNLGRKENKYVSIVVDEAHVFIDERSPAALFFMYQMVKRIRKYNGIFVVITQNVNDFVGSANIKKYTTAIVNGCQYSFIFGLNPADLQSLMDLYASVGGFSEEERLFIGNAGIGQCLFVVAPGQRITMQRILISRDEEKAFK